MHYDQRKQTQLHAIVLKCIEKMQRIHVPKNQELCEQNTEHKALQSKRSAMAKEVKSPQGTRKAMATNLAGKKREYSALQQENQAKKREAESKNRQINELKQRHSKERRRRRTSRRSTQIGLLVEEVSNCGEQEGSRAGLFL